MSYLGFSWVKYPGPAGRPCYFGFNTHANRTLLVSPSILSSLSLTPTSCPSFRMHFGMLCQQVVFALTGCNVRMCTEVRVECNLLRHMPKYGIKMIVEPELWNSLGRAWAWLSNFIFRFSKKTPDQWMVILIVIPDSYKKTLPTR